MTAAAAAATYRPVDPGHGACHVCDEVHPLTQRHKLPSFVNRHGVRQKPYLLPIHGPQGNRCDGGHHEPKPWLEATGLPDWDAMSDLDRGAALMFVWKVKWEADYGYAREHYPARYVEHPLLTALDNRTACRHASHVAGRWDEAKERFGAAEVQRLYDLALNHQR